MTGFNLGPEPVSEEGGAEGGGVGGVASEEDQGMSPPAGYGEETSEDVDNPILETPPVVPEEWVKELTKIPGVDGYYVGNTANATISFQKKKSEGVNIMGVNDTYFSVRKFELVSGRKLNASDYQSFSRVIMLDEGLASTLFGTESALNQVVAVGDNNYRVVGIFKDPNAGSALYGASSGGSALMANTQVASEFGTEEISTIVVHIPDVKQIKSTGIEAAKKLTELSGVRQGEFQIFNMDSLLEQTNQMLSIMTTVIGAIAGISLLVGGIGVMNIMLVSVTERTKEIGLKKAIGARKKTILGQFLTEASVLTSIGGIIGVITGIGLSKVVGKVTGSPTAISVPSIVIAVLFSTVIGVVFGLLPSVKAANLNPIDALRSE